jgi:phage gp36-like protein
MAYASSDDMIARYPNRDLVQLTNDDPAQTSVNSAVLSIALNDASAEIDGYLEGRFALPLTDSPAILTRLACDIAMYRLQSLRPLHDLADARTRYEDAVGFLRRIASGEVNLGLAPDDVEPESSDASVITDAGGDSSKVLPQRIFDRGSLKGY